MRNRMTIGAGVALAALSLGAAAAPVLADDDDRDVERTARCSMNSRIDLDLSTENGRVEVEVEVEVEVDEGRTGSRWSVVANRNGTRILSQSAVTRGRSGSFEVRRVVSPGSPRTTVAAVARRAATGEVCRVRATL